MPLRPLPAQHLLKDFPSSPFWGGGVGGRSVFGPARVAKCHAPAFGRAEVQRVRGAGGLCTAATPTDDLGAIPGVRAAVQVRGGHLCGSRGAGPAGMDGPRRSCGAVFAACVPQSRAVRKMLFSR